MLGMLGHGKFANDIYAIQTIKDNVARFTPEILEEINQVVVQAGLKQTKILKKGNLRSSEGLSLQVGDIDGERMRVHIRNAKGNKDRLVPISDLALSVL